MAIIDAHATADGRAVRCDIDDCTAVLEPGERSTPPGPWTTDQAIEAALSQGWLIDIFTPAPVPQPTAADVAACTDLTELAAMHAAATSPELRALIRARKAEITEPADGALIPSGGAS